MNKRASSPLLLSAGATTLRARALVFDKDGVLFDQFGLFGRLHSLRKRDLESEIGPLPAAQYDDWAGVQTGVVDPAGPLALAELSHEAVLLAGLIYQSTHRSWLHCLETARCIFARADAKLETKEIVPLPGCPDAIQALARTGFHLALITGDSRRRTLEQLAAVGLKDAFRVVATGDDSGPIKPDPAVLSKALGALGVAAGDAIMVGDTENDWSMAAAAGVRAIAVAACPPSSTAVIATVPDISHLQPKI